TTFGQYPDRKPDWTNAAGVLSLLKEVWGRTKNACPDLPAGPTASIDDAVAKLNQALPAKDQKSATSAANQVGLPVPELFDVFHPDIPTEVVRMDATFRQIGLDAHFSSWSGVVADVASIKKDWTNAKPTVAARAPMCHRVGGTATVVGDIDASVTNL